MWLPTKEDAGIAIETMFELGMGLGFVVIMMPIGIIALIVGFIIGIFRTMHDWVTR